MTPILPYIPHCTKFTTIFTSWFPLPWVIFLLHIFKTCVLIQSTYRCNVMNLNDIHNKPSFCCDAEMMTTNIHCLFGLTVNRIYLKLYPRLQCFHDILFYSTSCSTGAQIFFFNWLFIFLFIRNLVNTEHKNILRASNKSRASTRTFIYIKDKSYTCCAYTRRLVLF